VVEPSQAPSPSVPPEKMPADDELEPEETQEVASEKDEPETGVQTRRGLSFAYNRIDSHRGTNPLFGLHR